MAEEKKDLVEDLFADESTELKSGWAKFEKIGDSFAGILVETYEKSSAMGDQVIYVLEQNDGTMLNVGLSATSHKRTNSQLKVANVGDQVAFRFVDEYETKFKGADGKATKGKNIVARHRKVEGDMAF